MAAAGVDAIQQAEVDDYCSRKKRFLGAEAKLYKTVAAMAFAQEFQRWKESAHSEYLGYLDASETMLASVESRVRVDTRKYWSRRQTAKHCNLTVDDRRLLHKDPNIRSSIKPSWTDLIKLTATLSNFKTKGFISKKQVKNIDKLEQALKHCAFNSSELRRITEALATKLGEEIEAHTIAADLSAHEHLVMGMLPDLENMEQLHEAALLNGDMEVAEEIAYNQLALHEKVLDVLKEQYPIIRKRQEDAREFRRRRRWAIFRMANRDVESVIQMKTRQIQACEDDKFRIQYQLEHYGQDDSSLHKRFELDKTESDNFLAEIKAKQTETWKYIGYLITELDKAQTKLDELARDRVREINRRLELNEKEEARQSGHNEFLRHANDFLDDLTLTVDSAARSREVCEQLNEFILDGCSNVAAKFDRTESVLREMELKVNKQHLKSFTNYYLAIGRLLYRKGTRMTTLDEKWRTANMKLEQTHETMDPIAKKYSDELKTVKSEQESLAKEIANLRKKQERASAEFEAPGEDLEKAGVHFIHPEKILDKVHYDRKTKVLDYREMMNDTQQKIEGEISNENAAIAKERELRQIKMNSRALQPRGQKHVPQPPGTPKLKQTAMQRTPRYNTNAFQRYQQLCNDMSLQSDYGKYTAASSTSSVLPPIQGAMQAHRTHTSSSSSTTSDAASSGGQAAPPDKMRQQQDQLQQQPVVAGKLPKRPEGKVVIALYNYRNHNPDELSFTKGDRIIVVNQANEEGWMYGVCNQKTGLFPTNYVHLDPDDV